MKKLKYNKKMPLTIVHSKEDIPFFKMSKASLLSLLKIEFDKMLNEELRIVDDWIRNKRCKCSKNPDIQNKRISLGCKHIKEVKNKNKIIQEADRKTTRMTSALVIRNMYDGFKKIRSKEN